MDRRDFFKLAGLSAASLTMGSALVACESGQATGIVPTTAGAIQASKGCTVVGQPDVAFSDSVDVLVLGSGVSGLSAAIEPLRAGYSVLIAEKLDLLGGESYESNGVMRVVGSAVQVAAGLPENSDDTWAARKQELADAGVTDLEFSKRLFQAAPEWADLLASEFGVQFADPAGYGDEGVNETVLLPKNGLGDMESLMVPWRDQLSAKGAVFAAAHRAQAFIKSELGEVCGVRFSTEEGTTTTDIGARCVVVATGGFASSQSLVNKHTPDWVHAACRTVASTGEGQLLCATLSGQLEGMDVPAPLIGDVPQVAAWGLFGPVVAVDAAGRRFAREDDANALATACYAESRGLWWAIYDRQLAEGSQSRNVAQVTSKNAQRCVGPCESVADLADAMGVSATVLKDAFDKYDAMVRAGKDEEFGRTMHMSKLSAPYYAVKQLPMRYRTRGGAKTDQDGRLVNTVGTVVPRVYCCGSVAASGGEGLSGNGAFGLLVGRAVVAFLQDEDEKREAAEEAEDARNRRLGA